MIIIKVKRIEIEININVDIEFNKSILLKVISISIESIKI